MLKFLIILSLVTLSLAEATRKSLKLCKNSVCIVPGTTSVACTYAGKQCGELVNLDKAQVLRLHNELRSKIATGKQPGFPTATKMGEVQWSANLAKLAQYNVETCIFNHDECRGTKTFPNVGQNIHKAWSSSPFTDVSEVIEEGIRNWYAEVKNCDVRHIARLDYSTKIISHFTQLVCESANYIGCAAIRFADAQNKYTIIFTCDYSFGNMLYNPVYTSGAIGRDCSQLSTAYEGLCAKSQKYNYKF